MLAIELYVPQQPSTVQLEFHRLLVLYFNHLGYFGITRWLAVYVVSTREEAAD